MELQEKIRNGPPEDDDFFSWIRILWKSLCLEAGPALVSEPLLVFGGQTMNGEGRAQKRDQSKTSNFIEVFSELYFLTIVRWVAESISLALAVFYGIWE